MAEAERSPMTIAPLATVAFLLAVAIFLPWYEFEHSSGLRQSDAGPDQPANETGLQKETIHFFPFRVGGDANTSVQNAAADEVQVLGGLVTGALGVAVVALIVEAVAGARTWSRRVVVALAVAGTVLILAAMAWTWISMPDTLAGRGVDRFFTSKRLDGEGFIRTTPLWGWLAAGVAVLANLAGLAVKYAGGPIDLSEVDEIGRRHKAAAHERRGGLR